MMNPVNPKNQLLTLLTFLAIAAAGFDYLVRSFTLGWTESGLAQALVFLSPLAYFSLLVALVYRLRSRAQDLSPRRIKIIAIANILYCILLLAQFFLRHKSVGSASYSIVFPLIFSGVPVSVLTFLLFFRKPRDGFSGVLICVATVFWAAMPIGVDALYLSQGGYRGEAYFSGAVIGTSYVLSGWIAVLGMFFALVAAPVAIVILVCRVLRARGMERVYSLSVGISIFSLCVQFVNWGGFVAD